MTSEKRELTQATEEAAESAWEKFVARCWEVDEKPTSLERELYLNGYHQGQSAASRWQSIEKDGLPTEEGDYLLREQRPNTNAHYLVVRHDQPTEHWRGFTHYQKIEFQPEEATK